MPDPIRSRRVAGLVQSDIRAMTLRCDELGGINLGQGICDTPPPGPVAHGAWPAIERGANIYTRYDGIPRLRAAIAGRLEADYGLKADPENEIVVTVGSTGAFTATIMALCDPGDRILLFEPYYGYHLNAAIVAGLKPDLVPLVPGTFRLDADRLDDMATGARAVMVNSPANPSGTVFSRTEMEAIADVCRRHDLLCITDEVYEYFLYDGHEHISIATLPGMWERTVTISGYSKTFSITGWRIGYAAARRELAGPIGLVNDQFYICAPAPLQHAVADGIENLGADYYADLKRSYLAKRVRFCETLSEAGLEPVIPEGAYYVLADITALGCETSREAAMKLLEQTGVASVPGSAFFSGPEGERLVRFSFAKEDHVLDRACELLRSGLGK